VGSPELARDAVDLVAATKYTASWVIEYCVFVKDRMDCSATTHGVILAKYVAQITKQQGRYAVGHAGGELEQIQFLLGHVSVQTTERYLGCKQRIRSAVNDRIGIEPNP
jgi:hypothetical protein